MVAPEVPAHLRRARWAMGSSTGGTLRFTPGYSPLPLRGKNNRSAGAAPIRHRPPIPDSIFQIPPLFHFPPAPPGFWLRFPITFPAVVFTVWRIDRTFRVYA